MGSKRRLFGTDGIRGKANQFPMTGEIAMQVGAATAKVLLARIGGKRSHFPKPRIIIGKDTRISGYMIEFALASGICSMGADVLLVGPIPTPALAFLVQDMRADAAIMVSASHNAFYDNGIKIFDHMGFKLADELEQEIEAIVLANMQGDKLGSESSDLGRPQMENIGRTVRVEEARGRYLVAVKNILPKGFNLENMRVVVDCANGAAYKVAPMLLRELGAHVVERGIDPNGFNINKNVGALFPEVAAGAAVEFAACVGISLDGDADRVILSDETGAIVDGDQIMAICAVALKNEGKLAKNTVVTTPMSNMGMELYLKSKGIKLVRTQVGDRYVTEEMRKNGYNFGGEQSGHIIFGDHSSTGDGLLAALKILDIMQKEAKPLSELRSDVMLFPQVREDVRIRERREVKDMPEVQALVAAAEKELAGEGRVFIRYSGTEPLIRVMLEGKDLKNIRAHAKKIATAFRAAIGEKS